ncbi:hypothetical protein JYB62_10205 [Algoriphagus lutimaris]|uniref:DUF6090 family protein n=1 Tax=Algoriphagus lutimaris TaxID=613197 RepID=UPI00196A24DF|nr:DUF6090 family protein [Algoriphagus lutimaris]MBN3520376.1 hypothetical protein [Algoriphagus lutimaris]
MIKFFKKIRQRLLTENKFSKYIFYAIGEIILVVVGILIALQVNTWNEWRKDRKQEKEILIDLKLNLENNITIFRARIDYFNFGQKSGKIIMDVIDNKLPNHDSLGIYFFKATGGYGGADVISFVGYEAFRNNGFSLVANKSLKDEILKLFENTYSHLISIDGTFVQHNSYQREILGQLFYQNEDDSLMPYDYDMILKSQTYYSSLTDFYHNYGWMKEETNKGLSETRRVLKLINEELE